MKDYRDLTFIKEIKMSLIDITKYLYLSFLKKEEIEGVKCRMHKSLLVICANKFNCIIDLQSIINIKKADSHWDDFIESIGNISNNSKEDNFEEEYDDFSIFINNIKAGIKPSNKILGKSKMEKKIDNFFIYYNRLMEDIRYVISIIEEYLSTTKKIDFVLDRISDDYIETFNMVEKNLIEKNISVHLSNFKIEILFKSYDLVSYCRDKYHYHYHNIPF